MQNVITTEYVIINKIYYYFQHKNKFIRYNLIGKIIEIILNYQPIQKQNYMKIKMLIL